MDRWQALFKIMESFNRRGRPGLAFVFGCIFLSLAVLLPVIIWATVAAHTGALIPFERLLSG